jgi:hypothetical protein
LWPACSLRKISWRFADAHQPFDWPALDEIRTTGTVLPDADHVMSRRERLERWAELLEKKAGYVSALEGTEFQRRAVRMAMRAGGSPLALALEDPVLRAQGLKDDTYGEARRFFELSDSEAHYILCHCHYGEASAVSARMVGARVRRVAEQAGTLGSMQVWAWLAGTCLMIGGTGALATL